MVDVLHSGGPSGGYMGRRGSTSSSEEIHSGHFMISKLNEDFSDEFEFSRLPEGSTGYDFGSARKDPSSEYNFGYGKTPPGFSIDDNLTKLFECLTVVYPGKITNPKWNSFRGVKFTMRDTVRLNNIIWREYHMQFVKKKKHLIVQFANPLSENHCKPEAVVMEGKYWKRRMDSVCNEYKYWRIFNKQRAQAAADKSDALHFISEDDLLEDVRRHRPRGDQSRCPSPPPLLDDIIMDFDNFDLFLEQPLAFPNPRDLGQLGNADIMQPGLIQLQPTLEENLSSDDLFKAMFQTSVVASSQCNFTSWSPVSTFSSAPQQSYLTRTTFMAPTLQTQQSPSISSYRSLSTPPPPPSYPSFNLKPTQSTRVKFETPNLLSALLQPSPSSVTQQPSQSALPAATPVFPFQHKPAPQPARKYPIIPKPAPAAEVSPQKTHRPPADDKSVMRKRRSLEFLVPKEPSRKTSARQRRLSQPNMATSRSYIHHVGPPLHATLLEPTLHKDATTTTSGDFHQDRARLLAMINQVMSGSSDSGLDPTPPRPATPIEYVDVGGLSTRFRSPSLGDAPPTSFTGCQSISRSDTLHLSSRQLSSSMEFSSSIDTSTTSSTDDAEEGPPVIAAAMPLDLSHGRWSIEAGLESLHHLVPGPGGGMTGPCPFKMSKATILHRTAEYIRQLRQQKQAMESECSLHRSELDVLQSAINSCCSQLPATGVGSTGVRLDQSRKWFDTYVRDATLKNWKFYIFSLLVTDLFDSYNTSISTQTVEDFAATISSWLEQQCSLIKLRPIALRGMRTLSTKTSILNDPSRVPEQATAAVTQPPRKTDTKYKDEKYM